MKGLPTHLQMILASQEKTKLEDVATLADIIVDDMQPLSHTYPTATVSVNEAAAAPARLVYNTLADIFRQALEPLT